MEFNYDSAVLNRRVIAFAAGESIRIEVVTQKGDKQVVVLKKNLFEIYMESMQLINNRQLINIIAVGKLDLTTHHRTIYSNSPKWRQTVKSASLSMIIWVSDFQSTYFHVNSTFIFVT